MNYDTKVHIRLILQSMKTSQCPRVSCADPKHQKIEFLVGDYMFHRVSPMKGTKGYV